MSASRIGTGCWTALAFLLLAGCGGEGGAGLEPQTPMRETAAPGGSGNGRPGTVAVFATATDNPRLGPVWVRLHRVELIGDRRSDIAFESTDGVVVNLKALGRAQGKWALLGQDLVNTGNYQKVAVTLGKELTVASSGSTTGAKMRFTDSADDPQGKSRFEFGLGEARNLGLGTDPLILRARLADWRVQGTTVTPKFDAPRRDGNTFPSQVEMAFEGTVEALTGAFPNQRFALRGSGTTPIRVQLDWGSAVSGPEGQALSDGQSVRVRGVYSREAQALEASNVRMIPDRGATVVGTVASVEPGASRFVVDSHQALGFLPTSSRTNVVLASKPQLQGPGGLLEPRAFLAALRSASVVEAEGEYARQTDRLEASFAGMANDRHIVRTLEGEATTVEGQTRLSVTQVDGRVLATPVTVDLRLGSTVTVEDPAGKQLAKSDAERALRSGTSLRAVGSVTGSGVLTATQVRLLAPAATRP